MTKLAPGNHLDPKGPCTYDVRKILGILDTPLPLVLISSNLFLNLCFFLLFFFYPLHRSRLSSWSMLRVQCYDTIDTTLIRSYSYSSVTSKMVAFSSPCPFIKWYENLFHGPLMNCPLICMSRIGYRGRQIHGAQVL